MLKIKKKIALGLILSILALTVFGTGFVSEADNVQTEENQILSHTTNGFGLFTDQHLFDACDGSTCDIP
ncbi:MAG: hypothetical protein ACW981_16440 [Candidatus Hodarchaeales archaeon]